MSSEGDALGASYSRGERDYDEGATTVADPFVPAGGTGQYGISFQAASAWAIALAALWVYRRAVIRALQAARAGTLKPRAALVHVRSALKSCSAASRRRFAATWAAFPGKPSRETFPDDPSDPLETDPAARAPRLAVTVDPPGVEDGRWTQHWDVSPRPSTSADDRARRETPPNDDDETTAGPASTTGACEKNDEDERERETDDAATFPGVARLHARAIVRAAAEVRFLCDSVPRAHRFDGWRLLYCAARDGFSLKTLYRKCAGAGAVVTLVEDERGGAFGAFTSDAWRTEPRPYGDGRCFVFSLRRDKGDKEHGDDASDAVVTRTAYRWDPEREKTNYAFQAGRADSVSLGGGNGFALWLDGDLLNGASAACDTFGTPGPLACAETFKVRAVEVWGFEPLRRISRDGAGSERRE